MYHGLMHTNCLNVAARLWCFRLWFRLVDMVDKALLRMLLHNLSICCLICLLLEVKMVKKLFNILLAYILTIIELLQLVRHTQHPELERDLINAFVWIRRFLYFF